MCTTALRMLVGHVPEDRLSVVRAKIVETSMKELAKNLNYV